MEKSTVIAPVGDNTEAIFVGIREFPTKKVILLAPEKKQKQAQSVVKELDRFKIPASIVNLKGNTWEAMFTTIAQIKNSQEGSGHILVNVASGDRITQCAATSAAFVNGIKAFNVDNDMAAMLPVLKFNYYKLLTDRKMRILNMLYNEKDCCSSLENMSKRLKMSLPLVSYHINGSRKSEGLKEMGLIDTVDKRGRTEVKLSILGKLLVKGHIGQAEE